MKSQIKQEITRQISLGITQGKWQWVNAGRMPCPHKHLNNLKFELDQGMPYQGRWIYPGEEGCMCSYKPVIPGFSD